MRHHLLLTLLMAACSSEASSVASSSASAAAPAAASTSSGSSSVAASASASANPDDARKAGLKAKLFANTTATAFLAAIKDKDAEYGISDFKALNEDTDPNKLLGRPGQYTHKFTWKVRGADGTLEIFPTVEAAKARAEYVREIGQKTPMLLQYVYLNESRMSVLRVGKELKPSDAKIWEDISASLSSAGDGMK